MSQINQLLAARRYLEAIAASAQNPNDERNVMIMQKLKMLDNIAEKMIDEALHNLGEE